MHTSYTRSPESRPGHTPTSGSMPPSARSCGQGTTGTYGSGRAAALTAQIDALECQILALKSQFDTAPDHVLQSLWIDYDAAKAMRGKLKLERDLLRTLALSSATNGPF